MFVGHFATGFAAKKFAPRVSLGTLFLACQLLDLIWPLLLLAGMEKASIKINTSPPIEFNFYPYSHSFVFACLWASLFFVLHYTFYKDKRSSLMLSCLVLGHWFLDLIVHKPDLPLLINGPFLGFNLWNHYLFSTSLELLFFLACVFTYSRSTTALINIWGRILFYLLVFLLVALQLGNMFGPPPPDINAVALAGNLTWLIIGLAYWVDSKRKNC